MYVKSFTDLIVWQKAILLTKEIYKLTREFPKSELYTLTSQMRRAAISIPSNIAEGKKRRTRKDFANFLSTADASAAELQTQIIIARDEYKTVDFKKAEILLTEVQKMLATMIRQLVSRS